MCGEVRVAPITAKATTREHAMALMLTGYEVDDYDEWKQLFIQTPADEGRGNRPSAVPLSRQPERDLLGHRVLLGGRRTSGSEPAARRGSMNGFDRCSGRRSPRSSRNPHTESEGGARARTSRNHADVIARRPRHERTGARPHQATGQQTRPLPPARRDPRLTIAAPELEAAVSLAVRDGRDLDGVAPGWFRSFRRTGSRPPGRSLRS